METYLKIGGQFSGVGAFDYALKRLGFDFINVYQAEWDKYARKTYLTNHSEPIYYVNDVHNTPTEEITEKYGSLDIAMFSPPCQAFSLAGKRKGEDDDRGILFYNSHEFIQKNNPRYFIFENVKGLLSDDNGKTFQRWIDYLGGKSVNGTQTMFPDENAVPYHVYYQVLNAKDYGVPQNRERIFIIGIRDDADNNFTFPKPFPLIKRLKDVLEENVDEKYYLSEKMVDGFIGLNPNSVARTIRCGGGSSKDDKHNWDLLKIGYINQDTQASQVISEDSLSQTLCAGTHGYSNGYVQVKSATSRGYEIAEINENGTSNCLTTVQKDNVDVEYQGIGVHPNSKKLEFDGFKDRPSPTLLATDYKAPKCIQYSDYRIRKLTPRECARLMSFPDDFEFPVSDSQSYKQMGNSIVVDVLVEIIKKLKL